MQFVKRRENDPQYLKALVEQKIIIIEEEQRKYNQLLQEYQLLNNKFKDLENQLQTQQNDSQKEILNLNLAIRQQENQLEAMKHDKSEYQFKINMLKLQIKEQEKQNKSQIDTLKIEFESQKQTLQLKLTKLQKNLSTLTNHYNLPSQINSDKLKLIEDTNRDLKGFSNQKHQRMIMIQNQQYANQIQFQAKQIQNLLLKNQKLQQEIRASKTQLELHRQMQNDLVKRSSLAQKLIKQLNLKIRQLEGSSLTQVSVSKVSQSKIGLSSQSEQSSRISASKIEAKKQLQQQLNKIRFQYANLKNHSLYLQNMQKIYTQKYQTLATIIAEYLQNIVFFKEKKANNQDEYLDVPKDINLDLASLKKKDVKQWKTQELETILFLIINQIKPFLSKNSLIEFPEHKNINISFAEQQSKQSVTLPKIAENYQKSYQKQASKISNRFKDIPIDISTKILRSNLRQWGTKVTYGTNIPSFARVRKIKSKSIAEEVDRSGLI